MMKCTQMDLLDCVMHAKTRKMTSLRADQNLLILMKLAYVTHFFVLLALFVCLPACLSSCLYVSLLLGHSVCVHLSLSCFVYLPDIYYTMLLIRVPLHP